MQGTLVIAECDGDALDPVTAELVSAARELEGPVTLGIATTDPEAIAGTNLAGVNRVVGVRVQAETADHEVMQRAVEALVELADPRVVLLPLNWDTAAFASGLAEGAGYAFITDVVALAPADDGALLATRQAYGGKVDVQLRLAGDCPAIVLLRAGAWPPAPCEGDAPPVEMAEVTIGGESRIRHVERIEAEAADTDLTQAEVIFGVGRGVGKPEHIDLFQKVAERLGVSLGASRPLVDVGLLPRDLQVGQSGVTVKPRLYVAFGISGAIQHLEGMQNSHTVFAVNTDENAPIFDAAHFGAQVDAVEVARHLLDEG